VLKPRRDTRRKPRSLCTSGNATFVACPKSRANPYARDLAIFRPITTPLTFMSCPPGVSRHVQLGAR